MEFVIYLDESDSTGKFFENFYGGALIRSSDLEAVTQRLLKCKRDLGLLAEVKWNKVTANEHIFPRYQKFVNAFFDEVAADRIKIRIMFTHKINKPMALSSEDREHAYFKLYYQFVKHAFGIRHSNSTSERLNLKLFFDVFPHTQEKIARFKGFLAALGASDDFRRAKAVIEPQNIAEVLSHEHVVLQGLDIILGSMSFRLNDKHLEKPPGARLRAKKTRAKEELYKQINQRIRSIHPHFNIGASTSSFPNDLRWKHAYRHWKFEPKASELDRSASKRNKKK